MLPPPRDWPEKLPPICEHCQYNLTGVRGDRCPECGNGFLLTNLRQRARETYHSLRRVEDANENLDICVMPCVLGWLLSVTLYFLGLEVVARVVAMLVGLFSISMAGQVFRAAKCPSWAKQYMNVLPKTEKAGIMIAIGLAALVAAALVP